MSYAAIIPGANSTVGSGNNAPTSANTATFIGWAQMVANGFTSAGWTWATDSGNINFSTVTAPTLANFSAGYDIFQMQDTLQNTVPVFVKVEYGSSTVNTVPALWITIGTGSDGAGSLFGPLSQRRIITPTAASTNAVTSFISGDTNRIGMALWSYSNTVNGNTVTAGAQALYLSIERTKDAVGNDTTEGVLFVCRANVSASIVGLQWYQNWATGVSGLEDWGVLLPTPNVGGTTGVQTSLYPLYHNKGGVYMNPGLGTMCFIAPTTAFAPVPYTEGATFSANVYGQAHSYMPMAPAIANTMSARAGANSTFAMRFE